MSMNEPESSFLPERVDEQIDTRSQATQEPDAQMFSALRELYREDREIVERVEVRLAGYIAEKHKDIPAQTDGYSRPLAVVREGQRKGPQFMKPLPQGQLQKRKQMRFLEMLAAVLIVTVLVSGMVFLFKTRQSTLGSHGPATPTVVARKATPQPTTAMSQNGLYIATSNGIDRIDLATNKVIWHAGSGASWNVFVDQGIVLFSGGDTVGPNNDSNYYLEAVNASNGRLLWRTPYYMIYDIEGTNGIAYVSMCSQAGSCSIDALKVSNGQKLWSHPSTLGTIWELFQNGVVYGVSYTDYFALNAVNGVPLWQKTLQKYPYQEANMTPLVSGGAMYFSSCNTTKQTDSYETCVFFAFNATNGAELWHVPFSSMSTSVEAAPTVLNGVVYAGSLDGIVHAYDVRTGSLLWTYNTGGTILNPLLSSQGLVYVEVSENSSVMRLLALKVTSTSHTIAWSKNVHLLEGKPDGISPDIEQGRIYLLDSNNNILAFQADSGGVAHGYHPSVGVSIEAFSLVLH